jgi:hypothetical protein
VSSCVFLSASRIHVRLPVCVRVSTWIHWFFSYNSHTTSLDMASEVL